jgi:hypothetical protein
MADTTFKTIHIFGYGEVQLIGGVNDGKVKSTTLSSLTDLVDHIKTFKPETVVESDVHAIHIFEGGDVRFLGKGAGPLLTEKRAYSFKVSELDQTI